MSSSENGAIQLQNVDGTLAALQTAIADAIVLKGSAEAVPSFTITNEDFHKMMNRLNQADIDMTRMYLTFVQNIAYADYVIAIIDEVTLIPTPSS